LKQENELTTSSHAINDGFGNGKLIIEMYNSFVNFHTIMEKIQNKTAYDVSAHPKKTKKPVLVVGSGATTDKLEGIVKKWKNDVICSTSQATALVYYGKDPTFITALDEDSNWHEIVLPNWKEKKSKLVANPGVNNSLFTNFPNDILLYRQKIFSTDFYDRAQNIGYSKFEREKSMFTPYIPTQVPSFGSVSPFMALFAGLMDYDPIFLIGVDFCCVNNQERLTNYAFKDNEWVKIPAGNILEVNKDTPEKLVQATSGHPSYEVHLFYKRCFISALTLMNKNVVNCGEGSALTEIPFRPIEQVIEEQGNSFPVWVNKNDDIDKYLANYNCFVLRKRNGQVMLLENPNIYEAVITSLAN
jgi:hypothetical protein